MATIKSDHQVEIPTNFSVTEFVFKTTNPCNPLPKDLNLPVFVDFEADQSISHVELQTNAYKLASGLVNNLKLKKGDVIAIFSINHINFTTVVLAALSLGIVVTTPNPAYTPTELQHQLEDSQAKFLFTTKPLLKTVQTTLENLKTKIQVGLIDDTSDTKLPTIQTFYNSTPVTLFKPVDSRKDYALISYSSGTTGKPKGVITSHYNLISNLIQSNLCFKDIQRSGDTRLGLLPFFHCYGMMVLILQSVHNSLTTIIFKNFEVEKLLKCVVKYKLKCLPVAPPVVLALVKSPLTPKYDLSCIESIISGAAPLALDLAETLVAKLNCNVMQGYGMTEASPVVSFTMPGNKNLPSVGRLVANSTARIKDPESQRILNFNEEGELWVKGPNNMIGYLGNKTATENMFDKEKYMRTGDIGYFDPQGNLYITDRVKELIKYKGYQVAPAELEHVLLSHPKVSDCCVIGIEESGTGELPRAYVVSNDDKFDIQLLHEFVNGKVAPFKRLRGGIYKIDQVPKSGTGKILRRLVKAKAKEESLKKGAKL